MLLDERQCYEAIRARDSRFDGRFFFGVNSTGIYCRPICSARSPRFENCLFFSHAAAAEVKGFRPCLRCRPELAPGNTCIDIASQLTQRAISSIEDGFLDEAILEDLAEKLTMSDRHLRRIFQAQFGVTPIKFVQTQRLLLVKRLLTDTTRPVTEIAFAAGFNSLRRFNSLFKVHYGVTPTSFRQKIPSPEGEHPLVFDLRYCSPFNWRLLLRFINQYAVPGVEHIDIENDIYRRTVRLFANKKWCMGWLAVENRPEMSSLRVSLNIGLIEGIMPTLKRVKSLFDLSCHPEKIETNLDSLIQPCPGVRVPGAFDGFEIACMAILEQAVGSKSLSTLAKRFISHFGESLSTPFKELTHIFPILDRIASASVQEIINLGINSLFAKAIISLAQATVDKTLVLTSDGDIEKALNWFCTLPQLSEEVGQYILMRALSWPDALFLSDKVIGQIINGSSSTVRDMTKTWSPWRSYAAMHLWSSIEGETS